MTSSKSLHRVPLATERRLKFMTHGAIQYMEAKYTCAKKCLTHLADTYVYVLSFQLSIADYG